MWYKVIFTSLLATLLYIFKNNTIKVVKYVTFHYKFWIFFAWTTFLCIITIPVFAFRPKDVRNAYIISNGIKQVTRLIGIKWILRNGEILAEDRGAIIVVNHQSSLDILGMAYVWKTIVKCTVVCKREVLYIFAIGLCNYLTGSIFIDRKDPKSAYKELQAKADVFLKNKTKIWIHPEGTRNHNLTTLLPFKKGAFAIAIASQVPIIPLVISPYYFINRKKLIFNKGHVLVQCLEPVPTVGLTMDDMPSLIERVHSIMAKTQKDLLSEIQRTLPPNYPIAIQDGEK